MTYSIVARVHATGEMGVAVQSHFFSVGRLVPWAEAGVGAVATQAFADVSYGPLGLAGMRDGQAAADVLHRLVSADPSPAIRQVAMVDARGGAAVHTGGRCIERAGHTVRDQVTAQANMMERAGVWDAMISAYERSSGDLADRLLASLDAAEDRGGDIRGRQSAAMLIVGPERTARPWDHVRVDVRVDDHPQPVRELRRLVHYSRFYSDLLAILTRDGLFAGHTRPSPAVVDECLARLVVGERVLQGNPEASFWAAVLLLRAGRGVEGREHLTAALHVNPRLEEFLDRLSRSGYLELDAAVTARVGASDATSETGTGRTPPQS